MKRSMVSLAAKRTATRDRLDSGQGSVAFQHWVSSMIQFLRPAISGESFTCLGKAMLLAAFVRIVKGVAADCRRTV